MDIVGSDILDTIDGAIDDWTTSLDAMRWTPTGARARQPTADDYMRACEQMARLVGQAAGEMWSTLVEACRMLGAAAREAWSQIAKMAPQITEFARALDPEEAATLGGMSPNIPLYRDQRPRWQSPYGPARRR